MLTELVADLESADHGVRSRAVQELFNLGPAAGPAVPALVAGLEKVRDDRGLATGFATVLGAIGPEARPALPLLVALIKPDGGYRWEGDDDFPAAVLRIGAEPAQERLALLGLLQMTGGNWKDPSSYSLRRYLPNLMRQRADRIIPLLGELLADRKVRYAALEELAGYGPQAADLVPALIEAVQDPDPRVAIRAALTLAAVDPGRKDVAVAGLLALLANPETALSPAGPSYQPWEVCSALREVGEDPVPHLLPLLRRHTGEALANDLQAVAWIGEPAVPGLRQELRGTSVAGRIAAARALGLLTEKARAAFADLEAVLQDADAGARTAAAEALVEIDAARADAAVPHLVARLEPADAALRESVVKLLARIGPAAEPAVPALTGLLADPGVRLEAAKALVEISPTRAAPAVPVFVAALEDNDPAGGPLLRTLEALGRIGAPAADAVPVLRRFFQGEDLYGRFEAARALLRVAPEGRAEAVAALVRLIEDGGNGDPVLVGDALKALVESGPPVAECVPRLEAVLFDEEKRRQLWPEDLFTALVQIDGAAAARIRARVEAGLQTGEHFDKSVRLLTDLRAAIPATWAPLLENLLRDERAQREWDTLRSVREEVRGKGEAARP
jgi:hypothetical protein